MDRYHVTKNGEKWQLKKEGASRVSLTAGTKADVMKQTAKFMENKTGSVKIHSEDGKIQEERTYQRKDDPKRTPG